MDYSEDTVKLICDKLENGCTQKMAAYLAGINESTFYDWLKSHAPSFPSRVEAAINRYKEKLIRIVNIRSIEDGRLALEVLGRRWPDEFGAKNEIKVVPPEDKIKQVMDLIEGKNHDEQVPDNGPNLLQKPGGQPVPDNTGPK